LPSRHEHKPSGPLQPKKAWLLEASADPGTTSADLNNKGQRTREDTEK